MNRRAFISGVLSTLLLSFHARLKAVVRNTNTNSGKTGFVSDPVFLQHHIALGHPETPDRMKFIQKGLEKSGVLEQVHKIDLKPMDVESWIKVLHTDTHIASIKENNPVAHQAAEACVRGCLAAIDHVASKQVNNAFCLTRPPGHHALNTGKEEGFCYYNTIAIAARYAQKEYGFKKILIVDWDYHHGNATEVMFYDDASVLYFSTHDQFAYPGTGDPEKNGVGEGLGLNINVHLPCGTNDEKMIDVYQNILLPAAEKFEPDMILISAGFDSREKDLLGCFDVTDEAYIKMTKIVMQIAERYCDGRVVSMLEGGYNLQGIAKAVTAHIKTLLGEQ